MLTGHNQGTRRACQKVANDTVEPLKAQAARTSQIAV